jgi:protein-L-isoaspartate(D-aspartate) O-methyltransferase
VNPPAPTGPDPYRARRLAMVEEQLVRRGVDDDEVLAALRTVPRHRFVPDDLRDVAYEDRPLQIGYGQTISQPYVVAAMTAALRVGAGDRVLEVGTGSGYQAAVLAELVSEVYTIELVRELAEDAVDRLKSLRYDTVQVRAGDGHEGWPEAAPFDGIMVTCGGPSVPPALLAQLAPGRRLVLPVGEPGKVMELRLVEKGTDGAVRQESLMPVRFVPFVRPGA